MKNRILGIIATLCLLLCFATSAYSAEYVTITNAGQKVDSITYRGVTVDAIYTPYNNLGSAYDSDTTYCCAAFVKKFYSSVYGVTPYNLSSSSSTPLVSGGSFSVTNSPQKGDIVRFNKETHWAIVKEVNGNDITIIQQNAWWNSKTKAQVGVVISANSSNYTFFRYSGYLPDDSLQPTHDGLMLGDQGEEVKKLQETLNGMTGTSLGIDGDYGANTEKAVKAYQKKKGLAVDGWYGGKTKAALEDEVKKLQETLNGMTGTKLSIDGYFGSNTKKAVKDYQKKKGLTVDGWYGTSTKAALEGDVKTMQNMLNAVTDSALGADGYYGPNTKKAVEAYQKKKGLNADGWYGDITKKALESDYKNLNSTSSPAPTPDTTSVVPEPDKSEPIEQPITEDITPPPAAENDNTSSVLTVYSGDNLQIAVDDKMADFGDAQPFIDSNSRTQVPIRAVSDLLSCNIDWNGATRTATITRDNGDTIIISIGSNELIVNGNTVIMDTEAQIANDRTYIPLRFIAEALGLTVKWI